MKLHHRTFFVLVIVIAITFGSPAFQASAIPFVASPALVQSITSPTAITTTSAPALLWIAPSLPPFLRETARAWRLSSTDDIDAASLFIDIAQPAPGALRVSTWIYALVAPFPTVVDGVSSEDLYAAWRGATFSGPFAGRPLLIDESTLDAFAAFWGPPAADAIEVIPADQLLDVSWSEMPSWAIVPFETLQQRWKVLTVDGQSPIYKDFDPTDYALAIKYRLRCVEPCPLPRLPAFNYTNRDPTLMMTLIMTGVTALVRGTAHTMEKKGVTYPGLNIRHIMREADILHVSNEIPFYDGCGLPDPASGKPMVFCSSPRYIDLLTDIGTDVIELTGNHFADYGPSAMKQTLDIYEQVGLSYFAGGMDDTEAKKPLLLETNGNKLAFIGCNRPDTGSFPTATKNRPGAAPCDFPYMTKQIRDLSSKGYTVITTFQWNESAEPTPNPLQVRDFEMMADAGASIVSGSQAHLPQTMEFRGDTFVHYGLGNLFFDQMASATRHEFLDRYVVYDGKVISIELLTMMLEDYSRPRPMTPEERSEFLSRFFSLSGWTTLTPSAPGLPSP